MNRFARVIASFLLTLFAVFGATNMASAHNDEIEYSPEAGSTVSAGIIDIKATFTEELLLLDDSSGHEMAVTAPDGSAVAIACLAPTTLTLGAQISVDQPGEYQVTWRTVSIDGHPVSGNYSFKVENTDGYVAEDLSGAPCANGGITPTEAPKPGIPDSEPDFGPALAVLIIGPAIALVAGLVAVLVKRKKAKN
ncbi:MAG: hypothetical protein RLZZ258_615 [Actinomycetota bacterium]|jgi:methionine-rich copper-binding protein CopC